MKRKINEVLVDVWAVMIMEKIENLQKSKDSFDEIMRYHPVDSENYKRAAHNYAICEAKISALASSVTLFNALEKGKYVKKFEEIKADLAEMKEKEMAEKFSLTEAILKFGVKNDIGAIKSILCTSFEEAKNSNYLKNIVIIDDADIYLTYKYNGQFGEIVSWTEDEYKEDLDLVNTILNHIKDFVLKSNLNTNRSIEDGQIPFTSYEEPDYEEER